MKLTEQENFILTEHNAFFTSLPGDRNIAEEGIPRLEECIVIMKQHEVLITAMYAYQLEKIKKAVVTNQENKEVVRSFFEMVPIVLSSVHFLMFLNVAAHAQGVTSKHTLSLFSFQKEKNDEMGTA